MNKKTTEHGWRHALRLLVCAPRFFYLKTLAKLIVCGGFPWGRRLARVKKIRFDFDFRMGPAIRLMYFGCYEPEMTDYVLRHLNSGEVFIDAGANIGFFSALALSRVGATGEVHSFEPVPKYFERLRQIAILNPEAPLRISQKSLGSEPGSAKICVAGQGNFGWNTMVPGFMPPEEIGDELEVPVIRLDDYIEKQVHGKVRLIKIDVEGYEFHVLLGLEKFFSNPENRPSILCEVAPKAYGRLGMDIGQLEAWMRRFGYEAFSLEEAGRRVDIKTLDETANVVFEPAR